MAKSKAGGKKGRTQKKAARKKPVMRSTTRKTKSAARPKLRRVAAKPPARPRGPRVMASVPVLRPDPMRELAKRVVDLTLANDDEGCLGLYADNAESIEPGQAPMVGIDAIRQKYERFRAMTSAMETQARNVWVDGNTIIIEWHNKLTFRESGATVESQEVAIHEVEGGKIVRERFYYDRAGMQS